MSTRSIYFSPHEFYHIYNRGTDRRVIFNSDDDYVRFQELLYVANSTKMVAFKDLKKRFDSIFDYDREGSLVAIGAYCLMPNHFHILMTPLVDGGISTFMNKISTGYSMYFNKKNDRTGSLYEGTFKSRHADSDEYLKYLFSYIHLNPVKLIDSEWKEKGVKDAAKSFDFAASFKYSSLSDYLEINRPQNKIIDKDFFPGYFSDIQEIKSEIFEWLNYNSV